jgi:hypothetical protein
LSGNSIHSLDDKAKMQFDSDDDVALTCATLLLIKEKDLSRIKRKKRRSVWVKPWLESRLAKGAYHALLNELQVTDAAGYRNFFTNGRSFVRLYRAEA